MEAMTNRRALWKTSSSDQEGYSAWTRAANSLCHRNNKIPRAKIAGFWFVLGSPSTVIMSKLKQKVSSTTNMVERMVNI